MNLKKIVIFNSLLVGGDDRHDATVHLCAVPTSDRRSAVLRTPALRRRSSGTDVDQKATANGGASHRSHRGRRRTHFDRC